MSDTNDATALIAAAQKNLAMLGNSATGQEIEAISTISIAQATVALAYEQHTANLIAVFGNMMDGETETFLGERIDGYELAKQIQNRLGL